MAKQVKTRKVELSSYAIESAQENPDDPDSEIVRKLISYDGQELPVRYPLKPIVHYDGTIDYKKYRAIELILPTGEVVEVNDYHLAFKRNTNASKRVPPEPKSTLATIEAIGDTNTGHFNLKYLTEKGMLLWEFWKRELVAPKYRGASYSGMYFKWDCLIAAAQLKRKHKKEFTQGEILTMIQVLCDKVQEELGIAVSKVTVKEKSTNVRAGSRMQEWDSSYTNSITGEHIQRVSRYREAHYKLRHKDTGEEAIGPVPIGTWVSDSVSRYGGHYEAPVWEIVKESRFYITLKYED
jgi:hypothetical protein